jgi:hypothetical protein
VRRFLLVLVIALIGLAFLALLGPELSEDNILSDAGTAIRDIVAGIGESIGFSTRGFAG